MKGFINKYDRGKGFGFITSAEGEELFFHHKDIIKTIFVVEFDIEETAKGFKAVNIKKAKKGSKDDEWFKSD